MPIADLVMNSDIAMYPEYAGNDGALNNDNNKENFKCYPVWGCCPPPPKPPKPPKPFDYPPYPPYGYPCVPPTEPVQLKKNSVELQICKLSKKAAAIKKMIENFTEKNKDVVIKVGEVSYNFGSYTTIVIDSSGQKTEEDSVYGGTILQILNDELAAIKEKLKELTEELDNDEEDASTTLLTEKTVTQSL